MYSRQAVVDLIKSWIGKNEYDGSYKYIIDIYNSYKGQLPRGIKMDYSWAWCACTWSALAIKLGYTNIMPIEISCGHLVQRAKEMGCWVESDSYIPNLGDAILYDWDDNGIGDNTGWPDHIGTIIEVNKPGGYFVVAEGNCNDQVKTRKVYFNSKFIRGFVAPKYDSEISNPKPVKIQNGTKTIDDIAKEVLQGVWGNGEDRIAKLKNTGYNPDEIQNIVNQLLSKPKKSKDDIAKEVLQGIWGNGEDRIYKLKKAGYNPEEIQNIVNQLTHVTKNNASVTQTIKATEDPILFNKNVAGEYITTADLNLRDGVGLNKPLLTTLKKGKNRVNCYGYYSVAGNGVKWLYVEVIENNIRYIGFCCSEYLRR